MKERERELPILHSLALESAPNEAALPAASGSAKSSALKNCSKAGSAKFNRDFHQGINQSIHSSGRYRIKALRACEISHFD